MKKNKPLVLILCGGRSLRLWPLSEYKSKNFIDIFGFSPLEITIKRFLKITPKENIFLIANQAEKKDLSKIKLIKKANIILEPDSKNTAAAILYAVNRFKNNPKNVAIISPVDHFIKKEKEFYLALRTAIKAAKQGYISTLGIKPTSATPHFGYIQPSKRIMKGAFSVSKFIEKPSVQKAKKLIKKGCFYNSGMFIASVGVLDEEYKKYYFPYGRFSQAFKKKKIKALYEKLPDIPFDKAIMEKSKRTCIVKGNFCWSDFGNWQVIHQTLAQDKKGNVKLSGTFVCEGNNNCIYLDNPKKKVLVLGLNDTFLIDTKDYILLADRASLDRLKPALKQFKKYI